MELDQLIARRKAEAAEAAVEALPDGGTGPGPEEDIGNQDGGKSADASSMNNEVGTDGSVREQEPDDPCYPPSKLAADPANCGRCGRACPTGVGRIAGYPLR